MKPKARKKFALFLLVGSIIAWPVTALTIFKDEPQGILGLSWFAIALTAVDVLATTDVRDSTDDSEEE